MLRIHLMPQWFTLSDPGMEKDFFDTPFLQKFAPLNELARLPNETTILRLSPPAGRAPIGSAAPTHRQRAFEPARILLKAGTAAGARLIAAPTLTKNKGKARDPEMHASKKANQWYFGMKAHIGVGTGFVLVQTVRGASGHASDIG